MAKTKENERKKEKDQEDSGDNEDPGVIRKLEANETGKDSPSQRLKKKSNQTKDGGEDGEEGQQQNVDDFKEANNKEGGVDQIPKAKDEDMMADVGGGGGMGAEGGERGGGGAGGESFLMSAQVGASGMGGISGGVGVDSNKKSGIGADGQIQILDNERGGGKGGTDRQHRRQPTVHLNFLPEIRKPLRQNSLSDLSHLPLETSKYESLITDDEEHRKVSKGISRPTTIHPRHAMVITMTLFLTGIAVLSLHFYYTYPLHMFNLVPPKSLDCQWTEWLSINGNDCKCDDIISRTSISQKCRDEIIRCADRPCPVTMLETNCFCWDDEPCYDDYRNYMYLRRNQIHSCPQFYSKRTTDREISLYWQCAFGAHPIIPICQTHLNRRKVEVVNRNGKHEKGGENQWEKYFELDVIWNEGNRLEVA